MRDKQLLQGEALAAAVAGLGGWASDGQTLAKTFKWTSFKAALAFVNAVGALAEAQDHHPDIDLRYATVTLRLSSHDAGGITTRDVRLAASIDGLGA